MIPNISRYQISLTNPPKNIQNKRANWHDYRSRRIYMVTIMKRPGIPDFSVIKGRVVNGKADAVSQHLRLGHHIARALRDLPLRYPEFNLLQYIFMPDHIHLLFEISSQTKSHLTEIIYNFKQDCDNRYRAILSREYNFEFNGHIFYDGYNDRILSGSNQLRVLIEYLRDNPRRLYLKRAFPEYFCNGLKLLTPTARFAIYGNPLLLNHPLKTQVRFSSKYSYFELEERMCIWEETIRCQGVLVSPFYHQKEKRTLHNALESGASVIMICDKTFTERWKPEKQYFNHCAQGQMLFVGPIEKYGAGGGISRELCLKHNDDAAHIAQLRRGEYTICRL